MEVGEGVGGGDAGRRADDVVEQGEQLLGALADDLGQQVEPDGQLGAYLDSLNRLRALAEEQELTAVWPGHGPVIDDALGALDFYLAHRRERLEQVREALRTLDPGTAPDDVPRQVVETVYVDVDPVLWGAAELSVRAQIDYLRRP